MAFGEKCYCCGKVYPRDDLFYCEECLMKLSKAFETGEGVVFNGVTAAFYKSDEYNSREYRYSNLSELRKAMKHKEGGTNGKAQ